MAKASTKQSATGPVKRWTTRKAKGRPVYSAVLDRNSRARLETLLAELWRKFFEVVETAHPDGDWDLVICEVWPETGDFALYPATLGYELGDSRVVTQLSVRTIATAYEDLPDPDEKPKDFDKAYDQLLKRMSDAITTACDRALRKSSKHKNLAVYLIDSPEVIRPKDMKLLRGKRIDSRRLNRKPTKRRQPAGQPPASQSVFDRLVAEYEARVNVDRRIVSVDEADDSLFDLLVQIPDLRELHTGGYLNTSSVTDAGVAKLAALKKLTWLELEDAHITSRSANTISKLKELRLLNLSQTAIDNSACAKLAQLPRLRILHVAGTAVGDAGVRHLAKLPSLIWLDLESTKITDKSMAHLSKHPKLERLDINNTAVTDAGIPHLPVPPLKHLEVEGSQVTIEGLRVLAKRRPMMQIDGDARLHYWLKEQDKLK